MTLRQKVLFTVGVLVTLCIAIFFFGILRLLNILHETKRELRNLQHETIRLSKQKSAATVLAQEIVLIESYKDEIANIFLKEKDIIQFIATVERFAERHDLRVQMSASGATGVAQKGFSFQIIVSGAFPDILRFLMVLQNLPYFVEVQVFDAHRIDKVEAVRQELREFLEIGDVEARIEVFVPLE